MSRRPAIPVADIRNTPVIGVITCHTGYVGETSRSLEVFTPSDDVDVWASEAANDNAQSFGNEGKYVCPECGDEGQEHCESCEVDCEWEEYEGAEGSATMFQFGRLGSLYEGTEDVYNALVEVGAVTGLVGGVLQGIDMERLKAATDFDETEWAEFCATLLGQHKRHLQELERAKPKVFGKRGNVPSFGWTLEGIETAIAISNESECGMDEALAGGDLAASEVVIRDLVNYVYQLQDKLGIRKAGHNA